MSNDPLNLNEAAEWQGLWWLPEAPDERLPGVLRYDGKGGLSLSLIGAFEERIFQQLAPGVKDELEGLRVWDVIYGVAQQREITLLGCVPIRSRRSIGARVESPDTQIASVTTAIIGAHIRGREDAAFAAAEISVEDLTLWAASSVFSESLGFCDGELDGTGTISVKPVEMETVTVDGTEYCLEHAHTLPFFERRKGEIVGRMCDAVSIRVCRAETFSLKTALRILGCGGGVGMGSGPAR